jgi:hypothetical protein
MLRTGSRHWWRTRPGAGWRSALGIAEPSHQLDAAIESLDEPMLAARPTFDAVLAAACEDRPGEQPLDELVRAVLRSTLEQHSSRHGAALGGRQPK